MEQPQKNKSHKALWIVLTVVVLLLAAGGGALFGVFRAQKEYDIAPAATPAPVLELPVQTENPEEERPATVAYARREDIQTILLMGIDDSADKEYTMIGNGGCSDTMILLILNTTEKTVDLLVLNRDTMTDIDFYNAEGNYMYSGTAHLTMQYSFGIDSTMSAKITAKTISGLLYGVPIDHYVSLRFDAVRSVVELMGGIPITFDRDFTVINPAYREGVTVRMYGKTVEQFLRKRDWTNDETNESRMDRQIWFIRQVTNYVKNECSAMDLATRIVPIVLKNITTDMSAAELISLAGYEYSGISYRLPGEAVRGEVHDEFYVDEDALKEMVAELFYEQIEQ